MKASQKTIAIVIAAVLLIINAPAALALPPLPSSFYGTIKSNNANVPMGTPVVALINGVQYAATNVTQLYQGDTVYSMSVPGDDPETPGVIEGGVQGQMIVFRMGTQTTADQTGVWRSGTNVSLNLSANPTAVTVQGLSARIRGEAGSQLVALLLAMVLAAGGVTMIWLGRRK